MASASLTDGEDIGCRVNHQAENSCRVQQAQAVGRNPQDDGGGFIISPLFSPASRLVHQLLPRAHNVNSLQGDGRTSLGENSGQRRWLSSARVCGSLDGKIPRPLQVPDLRTRRMEAGARPAAGESAPAPAEGGAAAQAGQVGSPGSGVSAAAARGSDCSLAGAGRAQQTLGLRIQLWETGFVFQTLPRKKVMEVEGLRNFKELRAKFQNLDASSLSGPIKFPAGVSQKGDFGSRQSMKTLASGKPPSSSHNQHSPNYSDGDLQPLKPQQVKETQKSETQKCSNYLELLSSPGSAVSSQKASLLLDVYQSNDEIANKKKVMVNDSFRNKLWSWEILSQKSETPSVFLPASCGSRAFHLKEQKSIKLTPEEPRENMEIKEAQSLPSHRNLMAQRRLCAISEDPAVQLQCSRESGANSSPERSLTGTICHPVYDNKLTSQTPEEQPDVRHPQVPNTKPLPSVESLGPPPPKPPRPPVVTLQAFQRQAAALSKPDGEEAAKEGNLPPVSAEFEEPHNYEATISYLRHSSNSINLCTAKKFADSTYEVRIEELRKAWKSFYHQELRPQHEDEDKQMKEKEPYQLKLQNTEDLHLDHLFKVDVFEEIPGKTHRAEDHTGGRTMPARKQDAAMDIIQGEACPEDSQPAGHPIDYCDGVKALEMTEETQGQGGIKPNSLTENYDDVECSGSRSSDGKASLKRLQKFFKKEKGRFKVKKVNSKENIRAFSLSLPDLDLRSQEVIIYDDVAINGKQPNDELKGKSWKPKFLTLKEKKKKGANESERSFFKTKKQNLEKDKMKREERLFRERFKYDKEITVINTAVVCSNNSRNGISDLPITPGEELDVIDITEENLVICRNSEGKYGYVLIEHLDFKQPVWSP
ncbi:FYN-binding protein 2 [Oryx dammah]|uniref:FYN-binding protein 2 n=1 Tax=Oryx dammah TaxID=59534 RepID=UPI001A9B15CF|nr:FYN-binding protein 2 [Oryx dammah]